MSPRQLEEARRLADELVRRSRGENQTVAAKLRALLKPPPRLEDIVLSIPGPTHRERAERLQMSHQGYYNLLNGTSRPNSKTRHQLARLTGLAEDVIRSAL